MPGDFGMRDPHWLSRFGNATRQAATYRKDRVLLAGDAAHMHFPPGAWASTSASRTRTNLGWKLAATLRGTAPADLLDTYHAERHPVGARLLSSTRAQTALMTAYSFEGQALRAFLADLGVALLAPVACAGALTRRRLSDAQMLAALAGAQVACHVAYSPPGVCSSSIDGGMPGQNLMALVEHAFG